MDKLLERQPQQSRKMDQLANVHDAGTAQLGHIGLLGSVVSAHLIEHVTTDTIRPSSKDQKMSAPDQYGAAIAAQIRVELAERDWTQAKLAQQVGVARETLGRYLKGHMAMPSTVLFSVAATFDKLPSEFMGAVEARMIPR